MNVITIYFTLIISLVSCYSSVWLTSLFAGWQGGQWEDSLVLQGGAFSAC